MNKQINRKNNEAATVEVHWSEWLAGGLSALLIASLLCWLGYHSYQYQPDKADFRVEMTGYTAVENGYRVAFAIFNSSRSSAAQVRVVGTIDEPQGARNRRPQSSIMWHHKLEPRAHCFSRTIRAIARRSCAW